MKVFIKMHTLNRSWLQLLRGLFYKFCSSTLKKNGNVTNCMLFFNIIAT